MYLLLKKGSETAHSIVSATLMKLMNLSWWLLVNFQYFIQVY